MQRIELARLMSLFTMFPQVNNYMIVLKMIAWIFLTKTFRLDFSLQKHQMTQEKKMNPPNLWLNVLKMISSYISSKASNNASMREVRHFWGIISTWSCHKTLIFTLKGCKRNLIRLSSSLNRIAVSISFFLITRPKKRTYPPTLKISRRKSASIFSSIS